MLRYEDVAPRKEGLREAPCTLGNGYFATWGAAPEPRTDGVLYPGTYIAGCFNHLPTSISGHIMKNESLVNAPNWLCLTFAAGDGPWLGSEGVEVLEDCQDLDTIDYYLARTSNGAALSTVVHAWVLARTILVSSGSGRLAPVRVGCHGQVRELGNGQTLEFKL